MNKTSLKASQPQMGGILPGFTCCPACLIDGRPQEERMALPGQFSRVLCLGCGRSSNECSPQMTEYAQQLPQGMRDLVVSLISWNNPEGVEAVVPYRLRTVRKGEGSLAADLPLERFTGLTGLGARGHVDSMIESAKRHTIVFAIDEKHCNDAIEICFPTPAAQGFKKPGNITETEIESQYKEKLGACDLPDHRVVAVMKLLAFGFRITSADTNSSLAHIYLHAESGISATFSWTN